MLNRQVSLEGVKETMAAAATAAAALEAFIVAAERRHEMARIRGSGRGPRGDTLKPEVVRPFVTTRERLYRVVDTLRRHIAGLPPSEGEPYSPPPIPPPPPPDVPQPSVLL